VRRLKTARLRIPRRLAIGPAVNSCGYVLLAARQSRGTAVAPDRCTGGLLMFDVKQLYVGGAVMAIAEVVVAFIMVATR
jgi:hypothetical protein